MYSSPPYHSQLPVPFLEPVFLPPVSPLRSPPPSPMRGIFRRETATLKRSISSPLLFRFKKAVVGLSDDFYSSLGSVSFDENKLTHESSSPADGLTRGIIASGRKKRALFPSSTAFTHKAKAQDPFVLTQSWNEESDSEDSSQQGCPGDEQREELNHGRLALCAEH